MNILNIMVDEIALINEIRFILTVDMSCGC